MYYGNVDYSYGKSFRHEACLDSEWPSFLLDLLVYVNSRTGFEYNSLLINYYKNGESFLNFHQDDEKSIDKNIPICN